MKVKELAIIILMTIMLMLLVTKVEATTGKINSETVRLRKEPNTNSTIIEQLDKDLEVEIIEEEDNWYKIKAKVNGESVTGYVSKKLVDAKEENTATTNEVTKAPIETETKVDKANPEIALYDNIAEPSTVTVNTTNEIQENEQYKIEQETEIKVVPLINAKTKSKIVGNVKVIEIINDWCKIENDLTDGWVRKSILKSTETQETQQEEQQPVVENSTVETNQEQEKEPEVTDKKEETTTVKSISKTGYVSADGLIVRKEASTSSDELDSLSKNDKVEITGQVDGWYQIKLNGKTGYVSAKYISDTKVTETTSRSGSTIKEEKVTPMEVGEKSDDSTTKTTTTNSEKGTSVVEYAKNYLGCKYVAGGSSPTTGFDCSGFTSYVYKNFGVSLSRASKGQINDGVAVSRSDLQPGDIVVFNNSRNTSIGHVGIYIGGDNFIHAANPSQGVTITSLSSSYYSKRYVGARRVN